MKYHFIPALVLIFGTACAARRVGQIELFEVNPDTTFIRPQARIETSSRPRVTLDREAKDIIPRWGDPVRRNSDPIALRVNSVYVDHLPLTLTGSHDVLLFVDIQENAAAGPGAKNALRTIVYIAENQTIPGRLNFTNSLGYGPTRFKGHPVKVKFTLMVLQKKSGERTSAAFGVFQNVLAGAAAASPFGPLAVQAIGFIRDILRVQPDIECFDYEATFLVITRKH